MTNQNLSKELSEEEKRIKDEILELERASIANVQKTDDKLMVVKIINLYEGKKK